VQRLNSHASLSWWGFESFVVVRKKKKVVKEALIIEVDDG